MHVDRDPLVALVQKILKNSPKLRFSRLDDTMALCRLPGCSPM